MERMFGLSVFIALLHICTCASWTHCPRGNCTKDFLAIAVSCDNLGCIATPALDDDATKYLKTLELQNNAIAELPKLEYGRMDTLNLSHNDLRWIENQTFVECEMLQIVDLSYNRIQDVHRQAFSLSSMEEIDLSYNQLSGVPKIELRALDLLNMSHNLIVDVKDYSFYEGGLDELRSLDMSYNKIQYVYSEAFSNMRYLTDLHLQGNRIARLTDNVFHKYLYRLRYLDLSNNALESLTHNAFTDLEYLELLDLSNNKLGQVLDVHFLGLYRLTGLFLQNNAIRNLSRGLVGECDSLHILDVSSNPVQVVHENLFVHKLDRPIPLAILRMNDLDGVTEIFNNTFWGLTYLDTVELSNNVRLQHIQPAAFDPRSRGIRVLNLRYNKLSSLSEQLLNWTQLEEVHLGGNPWDCNCELAWMKGPSFPEAYRSDVTCMYPTFLHGQTVDQVAEKRFSCDFLYENKREGAIGLVLVVTMVFMAVGGVVLHKYRQKVFPCFYSTPMYRSFYNPLYTDEKDCVQIEAVHKEATATSV